MYESMMPFLIDLFLDCYHTYGHLTWEWHKPIRGFTHPLMYAALYKVMAILKLDFPILLVFTNIISQQEDVRYLFAHFVCL